jgi:hypothetical protein
MPMVARLVLVIVLAACSQPAPQPTSSTCKLEAGTATHAAHAIDAEDLRSMALPKTELGSMYASFNFDWTLAGFESNDERVSKSPNPDQERQALERFGRLAGYQEMYVPTGSSSPVVRIFTLVSIFRDAAGAEGYLANASTNAAGSFVVGPIGEQVEGHRAVAGLDFLTRVTVRRGQIVAQVGINRRDSNDVSQEAIDLARKVDDRVRRSLTGELRGYTGPPGTEIGTERIQRMAVPQSELGADYATFFEEFGSSGFQDNQEWTEGTSFDPEADLQVFEMCGRVTGFFQAFIPESSGAYVATGAHLFSQRSGATDLLASFVPREKRLAGHPIRRGKIDAVSEVTVSGLGDQAAAVMYTFGSGLHGVTVLVRRDRVIGETAVVLKDESAAKSSALDLARKLDARISKALATP